MFYVRWALRWFYTLARYYYYCAILRSKRRSSGPGHGEGSSRVTNKRKRSKSSCACGGSCTHVPNKTGAGKVGNLSRPDRLRNPGMGARIDDLLGGDNPEDPRKWPKPRVIEVDDA